MVVVDFAQFVRVVDHQPRRLSHTMRRTISKPVDSLDPGTVGQVKVCHGIERASAPLGFEEIVRAQSLGNWP